MKKSFTLQLLAPLLISLLFSSCIGKYTQVVYTSPTADNIKKDNSCWVYEDDTIKVVYSFWSDLGHVSFLVYNKAAVPMYIDWKKSSFINLNKKIAYYTGKTTSSFVAVKEEEGVWITPLKAYLGSSSIAGVQTVVKEERVTFIPPRSYIIREGFAIIPNIYFDVRDRNTKETTIDGVHAYVTTTKSGRKIMFRNFLTYSLTESFDRESYVDNEFYVKKVVTIKDTDFQGKQDEDGGYEYPWREPTRFYVSSISASMLFPDEYGQAAQ